MTDDLPVHLSREQLHSLEVPPSFETEGSFDVRLINHGESVHVHLHLDDPLSEVASLDAGNHYVEGETERYVRVDVDTDRLDGEGHLGKLKVASAYGAETRWVDIEVTEPDPEERSVQVDESLAEPQSTEPTQPGSLDEQTVAVVALAVLAIAIAGGTAFLVQDTVVVLGALVVLAGVVAAIVFLMREDSRPG